MKTKGLVSLFSAALFFGTATLAMAGAYGEPEQPEELPPPPPVVQEAPAPMPPAMGPNYAALGPYLGAGALYAFENFDDDNYSPNYEDMISSISSGYDVGNSWGFNVRAGYRFHPNFSAELLYEDFFEFDVDPYGHVEAWDLMAQAKGYLSTGQVQPYASVGLGVARGEYKDSGFSVRETDFAMRFGGGLDVYITENLYAEVEGAYLLGTGDVDGADVVVVGLGLGYKFSTM